ncbi:MAG: diguanylate cyclase [Anaerolineales bacterium]
MNHPIYVDRYYLRSDSMTGAENLLAFFEWLLRHTKEQPVSPFTLISLDVIGLKHLNDTHGYAAGDAALRWITLVLREEADAKVFRISSDEFVGVLVDGFRQDHTELCEKARARLRDEAKQVKLGSQAADIAMIHFSSLERNLPEDILGIIYGALLDVKISPDKTFKVYDENTPITGTTKTGLINDMVRRMVSLGAMLDKSQRLANTDSISGLPNMLAAEDKCQSMIQHHQENKGVFTVLLIDGDDLGKYNKISYLAGDEMIARLGRVLGDEMRPSDFLARWRTGDEFIILLGDTSVDQAIPLANRLREVVIDGSLDWTYPITISIGVAGFPVHGNSLEMLVHQAELGLGQAKKRGKNQVIINQ